MADDEVLLTTSIVSLARHYGRYGYRRITALLSAEGWRSRLLASKAQETSYERENGYVESFNGKLRDELLNREIFTTLEEAKVLTEVWRREYNQVRPHSALGYKPPAPEAVSGPLSATAS